MAKKTTPKKKTTARTSKTSAKKSPTKKKTARAATTTKKTTSKKVTTKKKVAKKAPAQKTVTKKKTTSKKKVAKKAPAKKTVTKKKVAKKAPAKKTVTKKKVAKKAPAKKAPVKKAAAEKKVTKKKVAKKAPAKKTTTKKTTKKTAKKTTRKKSLGARSVAEAASEAKADADGYVFINGRRVRMISTKNQPPVTRKTKTKRVAETELVEDPKNKKPIKTKLTPKELREYQAILLKMRAQFVGDLSTIEENALQSRGGGESNLPIHMADIGSDTYDQDFMLGLAEKERQRLREIDDALLRIQNKTYGVCQMTGKPIPKARLTAKPWAKYTIEAARTVEGQWPR